MAEMARIESHLFTSSASGCSKSSLPVFSLYLLNAASRIELKFEDGVLACIWLAVDKDMGSACGGKISSDGSRVERQPEAYYSIIIWQDRQVTVGHNIP